MANDPDTLLPDEDEDDLNEENQKEASKLMVDVSKVAITIASGAIAVNGALLRDQRPWDEGFCSFLASIACFIFAILTALVVITRTIQRAAGDRGTVPWDYRPEAGWLEASSVFGFLGIAAFVVGAALK